MLLWHSEKFAPVGCCIYCGRADGTMTDEHIIPFGLLPRGGDWYLPKASCLACADITKRFEGSVQQGMLGLLRHRLGLKTRSKRPPTQTISIKHPDGRTERREVAADELPRLCVGFRWSSPGLMRSIEAKSEFEGDTIVRVAEGDLEKLVTGPEAVRIGRLYPLDFARMLAKISHAFAVAKWGRDSFRPALPDIILGKSTFAPHYIGGAADPAYVPNALHVISPLGYELGGTEYVLVSIRLFAFMGMPAYHVIVGERLK